MMTAAKMRTLASIIDEFAQSQRSSARPSETIEAVTVGGGGIEADATPGTQATANSEPSVEIGSAGGEPPPTIPGPAPPARKAEIELKLLADPESLADFNNAPVLLAHTGHRGTRHLLRAIYFDTPGRALHRAGFTLRVRQTGARFVQTVKMELRNAAYPLQRGEWETPVPFMAPDFQALLPLIPAKVRAELDREPLQPMFSAEIRRHLRSVALPAGEVEIAFDRGVLRADGRTTPVSEIELELRRGSAQALYDLALRLSEHGALKPSVRSKAERGFDLATAAPPSVRKPPKLGLNPVAPLDEAVAAIFRSSLHHLLDSRPAAEDGRKPEGVHQVRVALRRLRSALALLRTVADSGTLDTFRSDAKWLAGSLADARSWDVFLAETLPQVATGCSSIAGFDLLRNVAEECRVAAYTEARAALADPRASRFQLALGAWTEQRGWRVDVPPERLGVLAEPAIAFAGRTLERQHRKMLKRGRRFKELMPEDRHRLRLAAKKLRYSADFFLPLFGGRKSARRYARSLAKVQEGLGRYNDMVMTGHLLSRVGAEALPVASGQAIGAVVGWQAHGLAVIEPSLRSAWRAFADAAPPWLIQTAPDQA